jgi:hypothetical protein
MFNETDADYSFASFRKYFPVPDGGWLRTKEEDFYFDYSNAASIFSYKKLIGGILKYYSSILPIEDEIYLQYLKMGEDELNNYKKIATISKESLIILSNLNIYFEDIISQRNTNAIFVLEQLKRLEIDTLFPINAPVNAPLAIPIQIKNRNIVYNRLIKNKIYLPIHWHVPIEYKTNIKRGNEIAQNELSIVIDQRYSPTILHRIFEALHQCKEDKLL